jgi:N-acyl-D-aspartate/D-glutamate deacylase
MHDLVIKNGVVVDGTGAPGRRADVAIADARVVEVGVAGLARRTIDAADLVVAPGFVDPHTHYDAQLCWDPLVTPSSWHGVTTVVMGNCGVGIAPCRPGSREITTSDLVTVEAMPYEVLDAGITWDWESFPEFMNAAERRGLGINAGFLAPVTPFRHFVMGGASLERAADPEERDQIAALLKDAVAQGALGFSTTTMPNHVGYGGLPLACRRADRDELRAYCHVLRDLGRGSIELALTADNSVVSDDEYTLLELLLRESGRPVTWLSLFDRDDRPDAWRESLERTEPLSALGARGQVSTRPLIVNIDLLHPWIFRGMACYDPAAHRSDEDHRRTYRDPSFRAAFRAELTTPHLFTGRWDRARIHQASVPALQAYLDGPTVAEIALARGTDPEDTFFDLALEDDSLVYAYDLMNVNESRVADLLRDQRTLIGLSDAGAHTDMLCDAGYCSYLLGHWVRDRGVMSLERGVKRLTSEPADFFGLRDRGRLEPGAAADLVVFDPDSIGSDLRPCWRDDFPANGRRLVTAVEGVACTVVNGAVLFDDGDDTGERPGRVLRSRADAAM